MRRQAFTILEIILVMAILVIIAGVTYPTLNVMYNQYKVSASCDTVRAALATARGRAIEDGVPYRFAYVPGMSNYRVAPDQPSYWASAGVPDQSSNTRKVLVLEDFLTSGIAFPEAETPNILADDAETVSDGVQPNQWQGVAVFLPDGTARPFVENRGDRILIPLGAKGSATMVVVLRCLTGTVAVRRLDEVEGN
jgi:prepilin-type N-terminal cleavage/methylation domain-containing protein